MARKFSKRVENTGGKEKLLVMSNFSFSHSVFKGLALQTRKNQGLFGKGLRKILFTETTINYIKLIPEGIEQPLHTVFCGSLKTSNFSFSHSVFKGLVLQTCKNHGLFRKGLRKILFTETTINYIKLIPEGIEQPLHTVFCGSQKQANTCQR